VARVNSNQKGKRGEREWVKLCREHGFEKARRSQQYAGGTEESADVVGLPYIHQEVKYGYDMTIEQVREFVEQAIRDNAGSSNIPIVAHKKTYGKWFVSMEWQDFVGMYLLAYCQPFFTQLYTGRIKYVTIPADDWFEMYKEFYSAREIEGRKQDNGV
jgi:Holliday junction resolvase